MKKPTKKIDITLHLTQYIIIRITLVGSIGFFIYSITIKKIEAIVFSALFLIYVIFLLKKVFYKPNEISFDDKFLYLENGTKEIEFKDITSIKKNWILYQSDGIESKIRLPNFYFMDKNWAELKELINRKN